MKHLYIFTALLCQLIYCLLDFHCVSHKFHCPGLKPRLRRSCGTTIMPGPCGTPQQQGKMLLIYFCDPGDCGCNRFKAQTLDDPAVCAKLQDYVCLRAPLDASIISDGKKTVLLEHEAFREMLGKPGIAIIDYRRRGFAGVWQGRKHVSPSREVFGTRRKRWR